MQLITMQTIARSALATLYNNLTLAGLVHRDYESDFTGKQGDTITVRTPATFTVDEFDRAEGIQLQDPQEGSFTVALDTILDVSFPVTAEELTLELDRFEERLLNPAMEAIAQDVDGRLAEALVDAANYVAASMSDAAVDVDGGGVVTATGTSAGERHAAFRAARRILGRNKIPITNRYAALSPEGVEAVTGDSIVLQANTSGSTVALREGEVGRLSAFDSFETPVFGHGAGDRGQADGVAFHRDAVALVSRTLERPMGVAANQVSIESYKGLGIRVVKDYDIAKKQDVISLDFLMGVKKLRPNAAVELNFGQGS